MCQQYETQPSISADCNLSPCVRLFIELLLKEDDVSSSSRHPHPLRYLPKADQRVKTSEIPAVNTYLR